MFHSDEQQVSGLHRIKVQGLPGHGQAGLVHGGMVKPDGGEFTAAFVHNDPFTLAAGSARLAVG